MHIEEKTKQKNLPFIKLNWRGFSIAGQRRRRKIKPLQEKKVIQFFKASLLNNHFN